MVRSEMDERFDRLLKLPGDGMKGLAATAWSANLGDLDRDRVLRAAIQATRALILPEWKARRPDDLRPQAALDAAEAWLGSRSPEAIAAAKAAGKDCTAARNETFRDDHRIPEAARAIAWAAVKPTGTDLWDALVAIEQELLNRIALRAEYQRAPEQRRALVEALRAVLVPKPVAAPPSTEPVPYSPRGSFVAGQHLVHATFGKLIVITASDKQVELKLEDGTTKRLAHNLK